jgi:hypothetical protein
MDIPTMALIVQTCGVVGTLLAATIAVRSYVNSNKRAEESKKKEQDTRDRELETRQSQLFTQFYIRMLSTDYMAQDTIVFEKIKFSDYDDFMSKYGPEVDSEAWTALNIVAMSLEGLGVLVHNGVISSTIVAQFVSNNVLSFWEKFGGFIVEYRRRTGQSMAMVWAEYLYDQVKPKAMEIYPDLKAKYPQ